MGFVQDEFNKSKDNFSIEVGEVEGPLIITRPCIVEGNYATLWIEEGPALIIKSGGVTVRNLRIDITGKDENKQIAIKSKYAETILENVEVSGQVVGIGYEDENWKLPKVLSLGEIKARESSEIEIFLYAAADAEIYTDIKDIILSKNKLKKGENRIILKIEGIREDTYLYGALYIKTKVQRRIYVYGRTSADAVSISKINLTERERIIETSLVSSVNIPVFIPQLSNNLQDEFQAAKKGQRVEIKDTSVLCIRYMKTDKDKDMDINGYVFLLNEFGKVTCDEDFVFFSNKHSVDLSVELSNENDEIFVFDLKKVRGEIKKIVLVYSVYVEDNSDFTDVTPEIVIFENAQPQYKFKMENLSFLKTVIALEIYLYKGKWKINFVGAGYKNSLETLCRDFGVEIE